MKEPEIIFYPIVPLRCFSNKQAFVILEHRQKEIDELKRTRMITKKKQKNYNDEGRH